MSYVSGSGSFSNGDDAIITFARTGQGDVSSRIQVLVNRFKETMIWDIQGQVHGTMAWHIQGFGSQDGQVLLRSGNTGSRMHWNSVTRFSGTHGFSLQKLKRHNAKISLTDNHTMTPLQILIMIMVIMVFFYLMKTSKGHAHFEFKFHDFSTMNFFCGFNWNFWKLVIRSPEFSDMHASLSKVGSLSTYNNGITQQLW